MRLLFRLPIAAAIYVFGGIGLAPAYGVLSECCTSREVPFTTEEAFVRSLYFSGGLATGLRGEEGMSDDRVMPGEVAIVFAEDGTVSRMLMPEIPGDHEVSDAHLLMLEIATLARDPNWVQGMVENCMLRQKGES